MTSKLKSWAELFPEGRYIFYEGDDPKGFVADMKRKFNFDPSKDPSWNWRRSVPRGGSGCEFLCPAHMLDEIYGCDSKYPMGS